MKKGSMKAVVVMILVLVSLLAGTAFAEGVTYDEQKLNTNYELSLAYIGREDYDKAMDHLNACLQYCDENSAPAIYADVHLKIACVYTIRTEYEKALAELDEATRVQPDLSEAYLVKTQVYSDLGDYENAAAAIQKYIDLTGDNSLYEVKAEIYNAVGNVDKALESYKVFAESGSENPIEASYKTAIYNMEMQKYPEAIAEFEKCRNDKTYGPSSIYNIGVCYMRSEDYEKALENFELVQDQEFDGVHYNTGVCRMVLNKAEEAIASFSTSIEKESFVSDALYNRAICYVSTQKFAEAIVDFTAYLDGLKQAEVQRLTEEAERVAKEKNRNPVKVNPENVDPVVDVATYYRGVCYLSINDFDSAIADFTACIDHEISVDDSRFNRGLSYLQKGDNEHAKEDLTECINNKYNEDASMFYRAYALLALGDNEGAIADLTKCIEHKYNLNQAYYQRAQIYKALGDEAHYIEDLEASLKEAE